jgi:hypothetical protein
MEHNCWCKQDKILYTRHFIFHDLLSYQYSDNNKQMGKTEENKNPPKLQNKTVNHTVNQIELIKLDI